MVNRGLKFAVTFMAAMMLGIFMCIKKIKKLLDILALEEKKERVLCNMFSKWVTIKIEGKEIHNYLRNNGYNVIAIYGMNYVGEALWKDIECSDIKVKYAIDKNAEYIKTGIAVLKPDDELPEVDIVIVTAIAYFDEIKKELNKKIRCPIVSLEDILSKLL